MSATRRVRIGIDVGGTFTHAVAIESSTLGIVGKAKVPTTHTALEGVARGVTESLAALLAQARITPDEVTLVAHSTTQATNALLEGDVAVVGIVGMGDGAGAVLARRQTAIRPIPLAPGRPLRTFHRFIRSSRVCQRTVTPAIDELRRQGAEVIVAAEAFSVDDPRREQLVCHIAEEAGLFATATHQVSQLHGLGIRTRTAVVNAAMIPRMLATAEHTEQAVRHAGIRAPVMIMRSDGGIMSIEEMRRRPILTLLSGPAAGVAAALLYARISDGLFLEVGGTSTDISVIKNGRTRIRSAEVGGHKLFLTTLDVRTIGLAGGSLVYLDGRRLRRVGPRSAHIAGLPYLSFADVDSTLLAPAICRDDDEEYLVVAAGDVRWAVTPTCASNRLGLVPPGDSARGRGEVIHRGFDVLAPLYGFADGRGLAEAILSQAAPRAVGLLEGLIREHKLDRGVIRLIAGGGGGSAIVPYVAQHMGLPFETVANAEVISAIGVALALVRDTVERTVIQPGEEDIRRIREDAVAAVRRMGAAPQTIQVFVEVDAKRNLLRATAEGATEIKEQDLRPVELTEDQRRELVVASVGCCLEPPRRSIQAAGFEIWHAPLKVPRLWRLFPQQRTAIRVLDRTGAIRWASNHASAQPATVATALRDLEDFAERYTRYSDAGAVIPKCYVLLVDRIIDLSGLVEMRQVVSVLQIELSSHAERAPCVLLADLGSG